MNAYTTSILKMKKLSQLSEEIVAVKHLIFVEGDRLLQEMVESHQTIFKSLSMSKIYFRQLLLQQQHANRLISQFSALLELPAPERLDEPPAVDQNNLLQQLHANAAKLHQQTRTALSLLNNTYDGTQRCEFEARLLMLYFLRGGANAYAVHRAAQLQPPEEELKAAQPVPLDILQTLSAVIAIADPLPEDLQRAADAFVLGVFAQRSFGPDEADEAAEADEKANGQSAEQSNEKENQKNDSKDERKAKDQELPQPTLEKALQQALILGRATSALQAPPEWPGLPQKAKEMLARAWTLQRSFERLQQIEIKDLELFLRYIAQYDRRAYLAALAAAEVPAVNSSRIIAQIQQQICSDDELQGLFLQINDSDCLRQCLDLQNTGSDAAFWRDFGGARAVE